MVTESLDKNRVATDADIYIPDIEEAVKKIFWETPGFKQLEYSYRSEVGKFVAGDVFSKSTKEVAFLPPPVTYYFVDQAFKKLPLFCVLNDVALDRLVSHVVQRAIKIRRDRLAKKAEEEARKAKDEEQK